MLIENVTLNDFNLASSTAAVIVRRQRDDNETGIALFDLSKTVDLNTYLAMAKNPKYKDMKVAQYTSVQAAQEALPGQIVPPSKRENIVDLKPNKQQIAEYVAFKKLLKKAIDTNPLMERAIFRCSCMIADTKPQEAGEYLYACESLNEKAMV